MSSTMRISLTKSIKLRIDEIIKRSTATTEPLNTLI